MKRLLLILALFIPALAHADVFRYPNWCQYGGQNVTTQGLSSTNKVQGSYPGCQVEVFLTGTTTHASIFSDNNVSPTPLSNPFTADATTGFFGFYAATACYDIVTSGAGMPAPHTESAVCLGSSGGGGGGVSGSGTANTITKWTGSTTVGNSLATDNGTKLNYGATIFGYDPAGGLSIFAATPTPTATAEGPCAGMSPFAYIKTASGTFVTSQAIDNTNYTAFANVPTSPYGNIVSCRGIWQNDLDTAPPLSGHSYFANSMHLFGNRGQQNSFGAFNVMSPTTTSDYSGIGQSGNAIYGELDLQGSPVAMSSAGLGLGAAIRASILSKWNAGAPSSIFDLTAFGFGAANTPGFTYVHPNIYGVNGEIQNFLSGGATNLYGYSALVVCGGNVGDCGMLTGTISGSNTGVKAYVIEPDTGGVVAGLWQKGAADPNRLGVLTLAGLAGGGTRPLQVDNTGLVGAGSPGVTGSGTTGDMVVWTGSNAIGDSVFAVGSNSITYTGSSSFQLLTSVASGSSTKSVLVATGNVTSGSGISGGINLLTGNTQTGNIPGGISLLTGQDGAGFGGPITISVGSKTNPTTASGNNLDINAGKGVTDWTNDGFVRCGIDTDVTCKFQLWNDSRNGGSSTYLMTHHGVPAFSQALSTLSIRDDAPDAAHVIYGAKGSSTLVPLSTLAASLTTTAATTDNVAIAGMTSSGHCTLSPTNATAATNVATTYISAKTTDQITVTHAVTASMTYDIHCTAY